MTLPIGLAPTQLSLTLPADLTKDIFPSLMLKVRDLTSPFESYDFLVELRGPSQILCALP